MSTTTREPIEDVTLLREAAPRSMRPSPLGKPSPKKRASPAAGAAKRKPSTKKTTATKKRTSKKKQQQNDERLRHVTVLVLFLAGFLLTLAIVSYSRFDQANVDVGASELTGLVTNDPSILARAAATDNWLGLVGAWIADFLLNSTIGWFALVFPGLLFFWGAVVYKERDYQQAWNRTVHTLVTIVLAAIFVGTIRAIDWMPSLAFELTGAVGWFVASFIGGLLGTAGAFFLLLGALVVSSLYLFDTDLRTAGTYVEKAFLWTKAKTAGFFASGRELVLARVGVDPESESDTRPTAKRRPTARPDAAVAPESTLPADHEPAHMIRRFRDTPDVGSEAVVANEGKVKSVPNRKTVQTVTTPDTRTSTSAVNPKQTASTPTAEIRSNPVTDDEVPSHPVSASVSTLPPSVTPPSPSTSSDAVVTDSAKITTEETQPPLPSSGPVTLSRAPIEESAPLPPASLRVHVEEGESDADLETEEEGDLVAVPMNEVIDYDPPTIEMLSKQEAHEEVEDQELKEHARLLQEKLRTFNIEIEDLTVTPGPVVTLFEFVPAAGIKLSQIESLGDDIALALKARGIRIIAPIPGKGTVGVEIPNRQPALVRIRSVVNTAKFREADQQLPLALGKTTVGEVFCADLTKMPHLLIAGATGAGKSVGINSILASLIFKMHPADLKFAIIDPKKIELTQYRALARHFLVECPDVDEDIVTDPQNAVVLLKSLEMEMDRRYDMLAKSGQRNIFDYNKKIEEGALVPTTDAPHRRLPYIVLIIDELADLMITAAKEVEEPIARLAQLARAIGIHMIVATQRPSVDVLTGMIKANFPARIAYQVATKIDSRTILDMNGAEQLLGNGDMLYLPGGRPKPVRLQNAFITTDEVEHICDHIGAQRGFTQPYELPSPAEQKKKASVGGIDERDDLFDDAARVIVRHQQGSVSLLQRRLKVGYARAARIVDELEDAGIVGPFDGSKARSVLLESEAELEAFL